ncbi:SoxR reducing system RseC family protein [Microbulbifer hydrolyticus]|uniref:Positive regulator for alginate biosynthesis MucC n=1 Tax=Microbulbifer hydrolyticus TaxID=48074 RepID=A0A6P1TCP6_9GAMM|nr:SoxR reducing system RseC family protein [Microbulbifer hydrolyticus]MBB5209987.1 sigma-E factor negative regulatory protein RseC [Microbulbifer hydrolyticus]QHQ39485.1 positive regulator for alginate biosynthesis MucC [Microbulbifer hydrolyticus]
MIEERGRVVALEQSEVWVETVQRSGCHGCAAKPGCGTGLLGEFWAKASQVRVAVPPESLSRLKLHDTVVIGVAENTLASTALVVYLVPLLMLVLGALAGDALPGALFADSLQVKQGSELGAVTGAVIGLALGALLVRLYSHANRDNPAMAPKFLRVEQGKPCTIPAAELP